VWKAYAKGELSAKSNKLCIEFGKNMLDDIMVILGWSIAYVRLQDVYASGNLYR
jgi:hypothetical protein